MHNALKGAMCFIALATFSLDVRGQSLPAQAIAARNRPLPSLRASAQAARQNPPPFTGMVRVIPNNAFKADTRTQSVEGKTTGAMQTFNKSSASASLLTSFDGIDNNDNASVLGYRVAPPDTDGDVGPNHFVQQVNSVTSVFDKAGGFVAGGSPFPTNAFWSGMGGSCDLYNQGDPIVLYDETSDRWLVSQFAFDGDYTPSTLAQCVAVSQTGDPLGAYNRYEFSFETVGLPDYPKHGFTTDSITMMANLFVPPTLSFGGTYLGAMDKNAMYAGAPATIVGFAIGTSEFGFVAGDLDDPTGTAGFVPALFATAMSRTNTFDIWEIDPDFAGGGASASASRIAGIAISSFDRDFCGAQREACIPQPSPGAALETLSDRMMHRLQIRDFGSYRTMMASHAVDIGGGVGGIRWYEMRESGGAWSLYQEGTFAPQDGDNRWMPSIAMNAHGDIGVGYLISSASTFMSVGVAGQSAEASGSGVLDNAEAICIVGTGAQTNTARAGDYSATSVDPVTDTFWHTNEFGRVTGSFEWATRVCEFEVAPGLPATDVHVQEVLVSLASAARGKKFGAADVEIRDDQGNPVSGASVTGNFGGSFSETASATTDNSGIARLITEASEKKATATFCVSDVASALPYDSSDNANAGFSCGGSTPTPTEMSIASIQTGSQGAGRGLKYGKATVTVRDDNGSPVSGVTIVGNFGGDFNETGVQGETGSDGIATMVTSTTIKGKFTLTFCASSVSGGTLPYNPAGNGSPGYDCATGKGFVSSTELPIEVVLDQNYPNPFNPTTIVPFYLPEQIHVSVRVFDMLGREVATLIDRLLPAGQHRASFDATSHPAGVFLYVLETGQTRLTGQMTLLK